jgi:hypothetical protein
MNRCQYDNSNLAISSLESKLKITKSIIFYFPLDKGKKVYTYKMLVDTDQTANTTY